jgi:hypothetical protein
MKTKTIIALIFPVLCLFTAMGQTNGNDSIPTTRWDDLPKAGEFGIGLDATPVFNYLGNMLSAAGTNTLNLSSPVIYGKYYLTDMTAVRAVLLVSSVNHKDLFYVLDDAARFADPLSNRQVTDTKNTLTQAYFFSLAYQKFIGKNKIRGFYGLQLLGGAKSVKNINTYGNPMSELNPTPSSVYVYTAAKDRLLQSITTNEFRFGAGAIAGFEYYVLPKLCIGAEVSLNLVYTHGGQLSSKSEKTIGSEAITSNTAVSPGLSDFSFKSSRFIPNGYEEQLGFYVMFHF